jgi:hypothetical protein
VSGTVYFVFLIGGLGLCVIGGMFAHRPKRACLRCGKQIPMSVRRCRFCEYETE